MIYHAALVLLGPVLFTQGRHVRRATPRLPEPEGERSGVAGQGPQLSLFIVGDSAAAGVGVEHQHHALSGRLVSRLSRSFTVRWRLFAHSGDTSGQLLEKLRSLPEAQFEIAVVSIGVNDVTGLTSSRQWRGNLRSIAEVLGERFGVRQVYLSSLPPMHLFPALPNPLRWWLGLRARRLDAIMAALASDTPGCSYVRVPYSGDLSEVASDGFHPGAPAYRNWGEHVADLVRSDALKSPS